MSTETNTKPDQEVDLEVEEGCAKCEACGEIYPHEGCGPKVIMGCCEGEHCTREAVCGYCSFYYEPEGIQVCYECAEKNGWKADDESDSE